MFQGMGMYLLLLLAIIVGWALGRLGPGSRRTRRERTREIFDEYFVGLNYLLNDEPDEAIDTFIKALELNSDTIETHLALGALLRRRGKVDKAIKVHQALLARPGLDQHFTDSTRMQLAIDYIAAGLLDRAERLLEDILDEGTPAKWEALKHLITIYQTEKEWENAIECSRRLLRSSEYKRNHEVRSKAAHYCCEQAEASLRSDQITDARDQVRGAFEFDRHCVRAELLLARIEQKLGNYKVAIREYDRVRRNCPEFTAHVLAPMAECYEALEQSADYDKLLRQALAEQPDVSVALALTRSIQQRHGEEPALQFLTEYLGTHPSLTGLIELLHLQIPRTDATLGDNLTILQRLLNEALQRKPAYRCNDCGFESRNLYWLCPSCQKWDRIRPTLETGTF